MIEVRHPDGSTTWLPYQDFEDAVRDRRIGPDTCLRFAPATGDEFVPARTLDLFQSVEDSPRTRFQRRFNPASVPRVTLATAILLAVVFLWQTRQSPVLNGAALVRQGAKSMPHQVELGQWWRLASASLLHSGWLHLVPNLAFLTYVGWNVETILGASGMALLLVAAALGSMGLSSLASDAATVGASGLTFAVFGAAVSLGWRFASWLPGRFRARYGWPMVPFVAYFLVVGTMWPTVDNFCHMGGLLAGGALGFVLPSVLEERASSWPGPALRLSAAAILLGIAVVAMPLAWRMDLLPSGRPRRDAVFASEAGYSIRPPEGWEPLGRGSRGPGWRSATGHAQLAARAWVEDLDVPDPEAVRRRWVGEMEESAVVVPRAGPPAEEVGLPSGWFTLESDVVAGDQVLRSLRAGVVRGLYVTTLEFLHSASTYDDYARLRGEVFRTVRMEEPRAVIRALEALHGGALTDPADVERAMDAVPARVATAPADALRLVAELARHGERDRARLLLGALRATGAVGPDLLYWDLWIDHDAGSRPGAAELDRARALATRQPDSLPAAALCFDVLLAGGQRREAAAVLERMALRWPDRQPTRSRLARLPPEEGATGR